MRRGLLGSIAVAMLVGSAYWVGCGGDEHVTIFSGNVSSVDTLAAVAPKKDTQFALRWPKLQSEAVAACGPSGRLLFCAQTSTLGACERVNDACTFELEIAIERKRDAVIMTFVDDTNGNGVQDSGEPKSTVAQSNVYCNGDVVKIDDADVSFATGFTTANVHKLVDRCTGAEATQTPRGTRTPSGTVTPSGTTTPSGTGTPSGTTTPTGTGTPYVAAAPLNQPPSSMLAFLFSAGAVGLLMPRRRRPRERK